jgi:hypothetical protein
LRLFFFNEFKSKANAIASPYSLAYSLFGEADKLRVEKRAGDLSRAAFEKIYDESVRLLSEKISQKE